ncbi:MAG TPA: TIGR01777 family oxidoreductase [Vicinamibacterales bacterium]
MKVTLAGGSGFLGRALQRRLLADGHQVLVLSRRGSGGTPPWSAPVTTFAWDPDGTAGNWASALEHADAIVNLAGESIAGGRWNRQRKARILDSRLDATRSLVQAVAGLTHRPRVLINASAQGFYGDRGDEELTEESPAGDDFLAHVCTFWEGEASKAASALRVVLLRTGIVLAADGGALPRMVLPFKLCVGGPLGSGRQFMSWIHVDDWVGMTTWALGNEAISGAINLGSPNPVRNRAFSIALGRVLHRPSFMPAPGFALRIAVGEMADPLLLASTKMTPARALEGGYRFGHHDAGEALESLFHPPLPV